MSDQPIDWSRLIRRSEIGPDFQASYDGECACGIEIEEGDTVAYLDGEVACGGCAEDARSGVAG